MDLECRELLRLTDEQDEKSKKNRKRLCVVAWIKKGKCFSVSLEKRTFYSAEDEDGEMVWKPARQTGMNFQDFEIIKERYEDIKKAFEEGAKLCSETSST